MQAMLVLVLVLLGALGVQSWRVDQLQDDIKAEQAAKNSAALALLENQRKLEGTLTRKVSDAQRARQDEIDRSAAVAAALRADVDGLRGDLASFNDGGPDDSLAACRERAATLGELLDRRVQAGAQRTESAEKLASDVRALRAAWPVNPAASAPAESAPAPW